MKRIGEHLKEKGLVTDEAVERALNIQSRTGSMLGQILQAEGIISAYKFYQEFAEFKRMEFINLDEYNVNKNTLIAEEKDEYQEMQYVPFDIVNGVYHIATSQPNEDFEEYIKKKFPKHKIFITSPFDILWTLQKRFDKDYSYQASEHLFENIPHSSSKFVFGGMLAKLIFISLFFALTYFLTDVKFLIGFLYVMNFFFLFSIFSKVLYFVSGLVFRKTDIQSEIDLEDKNLPVYSVLVPLYREKKKTISNLIKAISDIDYPKDKLDIKMIVETDDLETINAIKSLKPSYNFQIIKVPENYPKTKPKACNYALNFCRGEYITIYDAEDLPEKTQLKKALAKFYSKGSAVSCIQSRLNYYNREENILTKLFSIEYSTWFDYMLFGLQKLNLPIPLGGTSNHFNTKMLKSVFAWDPYNVTEDADLGIRIALAGLKTEIIDSITLEEAPISFKVWFKQRIRWIKGYLQTYIVHMRNPIKLLRRLGVPKFLGFFFFIGAPGIIYFTVPIVFVLTILSFYMDFDMPQDLLSLSYFNLVATLLFNLLIGFCAIKSNKWKNMDLAALIFPVYWILHCMASFFAVYELITKPHKWNKTEHGISKFIEKL